MNNPMIEQTERYGMPEPADTDPFIEVDVEVTVKFRRRIERSESPRGFLRPGDPDFNHYVSGRDFDRIIECAAEILNEGAGGYSVEYWE